MQRLGRCASALLAITVLAACSTGSPDVPTSCQPGEVGTCKGPGGCDGTATCKSDGLDFGPCACVADAGSDADAAGD
ncbi:MAG: hypothetical protein U0263_29920 [Polyangiaceae bacterium]